MSLKLLGAALVASLSLAAVFASSAFATATTLSESHWQIGGVELASGESKELKCSAAETILLRGTVAAVAVEINAKGVECVASPAIKQEGTQAIATGELKLSGLTVVKPAGCATAASITTKAMTAKVFEEGTTVYERFEPTATVPLTGCAVEGEYAIKGTLFGKSNNVTGVEAADQALTFSETVQKNAGGSLTLGGNSVQVLGKINREIVTGTPFAVTRQMWREEKPYKAGETVSIAGRCFKATKDNLNERPGDFPEIWESIGC